MTNYKNIKICLTNTGLANINAHSEVKKSDDTKHPLKKQD